MQRPGSRRGAIAAIASIVLLAAGCGGNAGTGEGEVVIAAPAVTGDGPRLPETDWRRAVGAVCRETERQVVAANTDLIVSIEADPEQRDEGEVSRLVFEASRPLIEAQLAELSQLRPPEQLEAGYQELIQQLALDLELTGRVAATIDAEGGGDAAAALAEQLGLVGARARKLIERLDLGDCLPQPGSR